MTETGEANAEDIHALIQQRHYDFYTFIRERTEQIDGHVEVCEQCHERMFGWTSHLPKLRARMTVQFEKPSNYGERMEQMQQLRRGQCLPCGCEVTDVAWTRDYARTKFYRALSEVLEIAEDDAKKIQEGIKLELLPLNTQSLRRLWGKFWVACDVDLDMSSGEVKYQVPDEKLPKIPPTIREFIDDLVKHHSGVSYSECSEHWCP